MRKFFTLLATLILVSPVVFAQNTEILGAGASFPAPLITAMADEYRDVTDGQVTVNYQSIGSSSGIRQFLEQTVAFGATEAFLNEEQLAAAVEETGGKAYNLPITIGDVVVTYNVPGVNKGLVLDGDTVAAIFLGEITTWNDDRIAALNEGVSLPDLNIQVVHRSDGSGSTNIWTSFLSKVSPAWESTVGFGTAVSWPTGIGAQGNEGVSGVVMNTPGAVGYNSLVYAVLNDIDYAYLENKSGNVIEPSLAATSAAANVELPADNRILITDTDAPEGYPAAGLAWVLVYEHLDQNRAISSKTEAEELVKFLLWTFTDGQALSEQLSFSQIPASVQTSNIEAVRTLTWDGEAIGAAVVEAAGY